MYKRLTSNVPNIESKLLKKGEKMIKTKSKRGRKAGFKGKAEKALNCLK